VDYEMPMGLWWVAKRKRGFEVLKMVTCYSSWLSSSSLDQATQTHSRRSHHHRYPSSTDEREEGKGEESCLSCPGSTRFSKCGREEDEMRVGFDGKNHGGVGIRIRIRKL
jgi:hypothetical protein